MKPPAPPQAAPVIVLATANSRKGARRDLKPCSAWAASTSLRGSRSKAYFGYSRSLRADRGFATTAAKTAVFVLAATLPESDISARVGKQPVAAEWGDKNVCQRKTQSPAAFIPPFVCLLSGRGCRRGQIECPIPISCAAWWSITCVKSARGPTPSVHETNSKLHENSFMPAGAAAVLHADDHLSIAQADFGVRSSTQLLAVPALSQNDGRRVL